MRMVFALAALATAATLSACSPAAQTSADADEKPMRAETVAASGSAPAKDLPVVDAQGNELDPELAEAVREKIEEQQASGEADTAEAPADEAAPADDSET